MKYWPEDAQPLKEPRRDRKAVLFLLTDFDELQSIFAPWVGKGARTLPKLILSAAKFALAHGWQP